MEYRVYKVDGQEYDLEIVSQDPVKVSERYSAAALPGLASYIMIKFSSATKQYTPRVTRRSAEDLAVQVLAGARDMARLYSVLGDKKRISKLLDKAYDNVKNERPLQ